MTTGVIGYCKICGCTVTEDNLGVQDAMGDVVCVDHEDEAGLIP